MTTRHGSLSERWSAKIEAIRALSVRQPWAWLIVNGYKDVENRSWSTKHRGPLLIHAGLSDANLNEETLRAYEQQYGVKLPLPNAYELGGIVGLVDVVDCKPRTNSKWHVRGQTGWVLAYPKRLSFRPCKGAVSLFKPRFET